MGNIVLPDGFNVSTVENIDARFVTNDRTTIAPNTVYRGLLTYDTRDNNVYKYDGANGTNNASDWSLASGSGGGGVSSTVLLPNGGTAQNDRLHILNGADASVTLTMPASPSDGDTFLVADISGRTDNSLAQASSNENIMGLDEDLNLNTANVGFQMVYSDKGTQGWTIIAQPSGGAGLSNLNYDVVVLTDADAQLSINTAYVIPATTQARTYTLPASPDNGVWVKISNNSGRTDTVIARNSQLINGQTTNLVLDSNQEHFELTFFGGARGWEITS